MLQELTFQTLTAECQLSISENPSDPKFTGKYWCSTKPGATRIMSAADFEEVRVRPLGSGELSADSCEELLANFRQVVQKNYGGTIIDEF
jgi:hypothetical protein